MELTLELGHRSVDELRTCMTHQEFVMWQHYAARRILPHRRVELMLARVCLTLAQVNGNANAKLSDFLLTNDEPPALASGDGAQALNAIADGVGVRMLGQGRKKKG